MRRAHPVQAARLAAIGFGLVGALSCTGLPEIHYQRKPPAPGAKVTIENARGAVEKDRAEALLGRHPGDSRAGTRERALLEEAATGRPLLAGNAVQLLFDGPETMGAMLASISAAKRSINLETYIFDPDELGQTFSDLLIAKQREGVQVNIIYDCVGTAGTPEAFFDRMRDAGIRLCPYHPINPFKRLGRWKVNNRDHRKILVVDGAVAFTGGANISGTYLHGSLFRRKGRGRTNLGWRDTHLRIEGPAAAALQELFVQTWLVQMKEDLHTPDYFPAPREAGDTLVRVVGSQPGGDFEIYRAYVLAIDQAARTIHLTAAYFVPDARIVQALVRAARRGVEVEIILTSLTDSGFVQHASQSYYQEFLDAGVRLYQLKSSILHAKTAVIDGAWSTVGSTNLDMRSFLFNKEVNVIVLGTPFGGEMEKAFREDKANSDEITSSGWARRSRADRVREWVARRLARWL
ncbi:cardiolipin synthase [Geothrix sp. 21YS21S-2]|uniref:cardiolipin synthase n=1 Tax=Geothrix sp. 21YS21S-2 TaxID=3068893 RepID=UPI0027B99C97|nr:cardiolipin synthase [Geothrix sp. 21YS21S-2]